MTARGRHCWGVCFGSGYCVLVLAFILSLTSLFLLFRGVSKVKVEFKMLLMFDEKHKKHLGFLLDIGPEGLYLNFSDRLPETH